MRHIIYIYLLFSVSAFGQASIEARLINSSEINVDQIINIDNFNTLYFVDDNTIYKQTNDGKSLNFSNYQLGEITTYFINLYNCRYPIFARALDHNLTQLIDQI